MADTMQQETDHPQAPRHNEPPKVIYTIHPKGVVGIVLMAILMLFSVPFSGMLGVVLGTNSAGEYDLSPGPVLFSAGVAAFLTSRFCLIAGLAGDDKANDK